ncbi:hypothetical protein WN51_03905 [Melipona quadrifasciata]|uniref:Uncharacterized protein n=1 Tax=Melipona quadrifasciata TaxID=166423 RepID=A0A0M8ZS49_9HYME|nr:hypothetical protein WN51_03905 [Melipona quadrifasciata]
MEMGWNRNSKGDVSIQSNLHTARMPRSNYVLVTLLTPVSRHIGSVTTANSRRNR